VALFEERDEAKKSARAWMAETQKKGGVGNYFRVGSEGSDVDLSGGDGSVGIDLEEEAEETERRVNFPRCHSFPTRCRPR